MRLYKPNSTKNGQKISTKKWYADLRVGNQRCAIALFEKEELSRKFAERLEAVVAQHAAGLSYDKVSQQWLAQMPPAMMARFVSMGLVSAERVENAKPIQSHVDDYAGYLEHKGNTAAYCGLCKARIKNIIDGCGVKTLADLQSGKIQKWVSDELASGRISQGTHNHYLRQIKGFLHWLYREDKLGKDIAKHLMLRTVTEIVKDRRALSLDEITYLLKWVSTAPAAFGLTGFERSLLYRLALTTGLRANEIRSLKSSSIDFRGKSVFLPSSSTKNKREAILPLRDDVLKDLRTLIGEKLPDEPLFHVTDKTAKLLRKDMADAQKKYRADGGKDMDFLCADTLDGEIDFHAMRHTYASLLVNGGCDVKTAQSLLRHSTPLLTLGIYSHVRRESEQTAVNSLPSFDEKPKMEIKKKA